MGGRGEGGGWRWAGGAKSQELGGRMKKKGVGFWEIRDGGDVRKSEEWNDESVKRA